MPSMRAAELTSRGRVTLRHDVPVPEPARGQARIAVKAAGICGTDVHIWKGDESLSHLVQPPVILGHEFCGVVDALGPGVKGLSEGDYVSAEMHEVCGACGACRSGSLHACQDTRVHGLHLDGSFADYVVVSASNVIRLPRDLPVKVGAVLDPLGNAVHTALKKDLRGRAVAVVGMGAIGAMTAEVAAFTGAARLFVADVSPRALRRAAEWASRRGLGNRVEVLDLSGDCREGAVRRVVEATQGGVDAVLETSGHPDGINCGIEMVRAAGDVVLLGIPRERHVPLRDFGRNVIFKGLTLHAIIGREMFRTWEQMLDLLARGLDVAQFVTGEYPLEKFPEAIERFASGEEQKVILRMD